MPLTQENYPVVTSYWGSAEPSRGLGFSGSDAADVVVVGGGLAGMSTAYFLKIAEPSLKVVLVEQEYLGYGASSRNFGNVPQLARGEMGHLRRTLGPDVTRFVVDHQRRMLDDFEALLRHEGIDCEFARTDILLIAVAPGTYSGLRRLHDLHVEFGMPSTLLTPDQMRQQVNLASEGGLRCGWNASINPFKLARGLADVVVRVGVEVHEGTQVTSLEPTASAAIVTTSAGSWQAGRVVLATNAFTAPLGFGRGVVNPTYVYVLATSPLNDDQWKQMGWGDLPIILDAGIPGSFYSMRMRPNREFLFSGGRPPVSKDGRIPEHDNLSAYRGLHQELTRRFPFLQSLPIAHAWGGPIAVTGSGFPVVGRVGERIYINAGCNGRGVLIATLSGRVLLGELLGDAYRDSAYEEFGRVVLQRDLEHVRKVSSKIGP